MEEVHFKIFCVNFHTADSLKLFYLMHSDEEFEDIVVDEEVNQTSSPRKQKQARKRKLDTNKRVEFDSRPGKNKSEKHSSSLLFKATSSSYKKSRPKSIPTYKGSPIKISHVDAKHKFRISPKKLAIPLKLLNSSNKYNPLVNSKPPGLIPLLIKSPEKSTQPQVPVRQQTKWLPRRRISRNMLSGNDDLSQILKQPIPVDGQLNSPVKSDPPKVPESTKSKVITIMALITRWLG